MESSSTPPASTWREPQRWWLVALVLAIFVPRLADQTIRGEESRWATVAREMIRTGDYVVPRQQGEPFPDRPPLHCWVLSVTERLWGETNLWALRLPSVLATLMTSLVIYGYARRFLTPLGALAAGVSFATMAQVLQLFRLAESDALFCCFLSSALLLWHGLLEFDKRPWLAWTVGYTLAALATLTKGPQGPVYFVGITSVYLLLVQRDWRRWLSGAHVLGIGCFVLIGAAWLVPFAQRMGLDATLKIWSEEGALRARLLPREWSIVLTGWLTYPWRVLLSTMPWSPMLLCYLSTWLRHDLRAARGPAVFLATCIAVSLPTVWLPAYSVPRYFMSMYPALAILIGIAIERCVQAQAEQHDVAATALRRGRDNDTIHNLRAYPSPLEAAPLAQQIVRASPSLDWQSIWWQGGWRRFVVCARWSIALAGVVFGVVSCWPLALWQPLAQPVAFACLFAIVCWGIAVLLATKRCDIDRRAAQQAVLAIGAVCGLVYTGVVINMVRTQSVDFPKQIAIMRERLPSDVRLVSLGRVHHLFMYYLGEPVELCPWSLELTSDDQVPEYFCFTPNVMRGLKPPFAFETITTVNCARTHSPDVEEVVVIGRRLANDTAARNSEPRK